MAIDTVKAEATTRAGLHIHLNTTFNQLMKPKAETLLQFEEKRKFE